MVDNNRIISVVRNLGVYLVGVASAVAGALSLVGALDIHVYIGAVLFIIGLALILFVHEVLGGPV